MLQQDLSHRDAHGAVTLSATSATAPSDRVGPAAAERDGSIRRRPDGSIDHAHYDRIARELHARDLRTALGALPGPVRRLVGAVRLRASARERPVPDLQG